MDAAINLKERNKIKIPVFGHAAQILSFFAADQDILHEYWKFSAKTV